ncbi:MAG TPA: ribosome recycling factor [Clostridia bacterium]|jgi:ribosome recycling factor|nr:ribosome recycling factor [Clostridia bacterium]
MAYENEFIQEIFLDLEAKCEKSIENYKNELALMRAGRANPRILDKVTVNYYGVPTPINQMANITIPEARMLVVNVWDASALKTVEKAIIDANVGIFPSNDGKVLRLIFPELNEERRKSLVKDIRSQAETTKIAIRNIRRDQISKLRSLEKEKLLTEDELKVSEKDVDKSVSEFVQKVDELTTEKEKEIMSV